VIQPKRGIALFFNFLMLRRAILYLAGIFILAFGVALMAKSGLGITPVNAIAYVISRILDIDHGLMTGLLYCFFVLLQIVILRGAFRVIDILQILMTVFFSFFISVNNRLVMFLKPGIYPVQMLLMIAGVFFISLGVMLYLTAGLIPQPADGIVLAIGKKTGWKLHRVKIGFDCAVVAVAALISVILTGHIVGLREGTLAAMLGVGKIFGWLSRALEPRVRAFFRLG
jgi:uncharacterized membrane protein YczE